MGIEAEEAENHPGQGKSDKADNNVVIQVGEVADTCEDEEAYPSCKSVQAVSQIDGIGHSHDGQNGEGDGDPLRQKKIVRRHHPHALYLDPPVQDNDKGRNDLARKLYPWGKLAEIVNGPEQYEQASPRQISLDESVRIIPVNDRDEGTQGHGNTPHPGDWLQVNFPFIGDIDKLIAHCQGAEERNQDDGDKNREK